MVGSSVSSAAFQPMKLRATATPTDAPTPAVPPTPTPTLAEMTLALIFDSLVESMSTLPAVLSVLPSMKALVLLSITFLAAAPAPLTATPALPPTPTATEAAAANASISALVSALNRTPPSVEKLATSWTYASTSLLMSFRATVALTATATPALLPKATPRLAAAAIT